MATLFRGVQGKVAFVTEFTHHPHFHDATDVTNIRRQYVYYTPNTFFVSRRGIKSIKTLNALYVDVDIYNSKYATLPKEYVLEKMLQDSELPMPNLIVRGNGFHLLWLIEPIREFRYKDWERLQRVFYERFKEFGADAASLDGVHYLRLPGNPHTKDESIRVTYEERVPWRYDFWELFRDYAGAGESDVQNRAKPTPIRAQAGGYFYAKRMEQLETLVTLRQGEMTGSREKLLFWYRNYALGYARLNQEPDPGAWALAQTLRLNRQFSAPLSEKEVKTATRNVEKKVYQATNATLCHWFDLSEEEKVTLGWQEQKSPKERAKIRRAARGLVSRAVYTLDADMRRAEIAAGIQQGETYRAIAKRLGCSHSEVYRLAKGMGIAAKPKATKPQEWPPVLRQILPKLVKQALTGLWKRSIRVAAIQRIADLLLRRRVQPLPFGFDSG